jgi:ankyrin repeat protein
MSDGRLRRKFNLGTPSREDIVKFCDAAKGGDIGALTTFLDKFGANIINTRDHTNDTALNWAAWQGRTDVITLLLDRGADIEIKGMHDKTALIWAAEGGKAEAVALLVERGADVKAKDRYGLTAAEQAKSRGYDHIVDAIDKAVDVRDRKTAKRQAEEAGLKLSEERRERLKQGKPPKLKGMSPK